MHSKWNLLQNLTRTIRQAGAREDGRSDRRGWMAGGWCRWCQRRRRRRQSRQRRVAHLKLPPKTRRRRRKGRREEGETDQLRIMPRGKNMDETTDATDGRHLVRGRPLTWSVGRSGRFVHYISMSKWLISKSQRMMGMVNGLKSSGNHQSRMIQSVSLASKISTESRSSISMSRRCLAWSMEGLDGLACRCYIFHQAHFCLEGKGLWWHALMDSQSKWTLTTSRQRNWRRRGALSFCP